MPRPALPIPERDARIRMRLVTPDTAFKVVSRDIYWTVPFLRLYLERCDEYGVDEPDEGLKLAHYAPRLAQLIGVDSRPGEYINEEQKHSYEVFARTVLASLCRRAQKIDEAEGHFAHAFALADRNQTAVFAQGELLRRYGFLRAMLAESDAVNYLDRAVALFSGPGQNPNQLADALNTRGHVHVTYKRWHEAAADFSRAVEVVDHTTASGRRTADAAVVNLAFVLSSGTVRIDEKARILEFVKQIRSKIGKRVSDTKARLLWMEGLLYHQLSFDRQAARVLRRARKSFLSLKRPIEYAVVSLELAVVLLADDELERYERLRVETEASLRLFADEYPKLHRAIERWQELPVATLSVSKLAEIKMILQS